MAEKRFNSRIVHKHDTETNWSLATGFTPMAGEIIIYDADDTYDYERIKIGDGTQNVNDLPFAVIQSNFSQNDEVAADYIQNRPFYDTITTEYFYVSSSNQPTANTLSNGLYYGTTTGASTTIVVGSRYKIGINIAGYSSTIFTCTRAKLPSVYQYCKVLGNAQLGVDAGFLDGSNSNYPIEDTGENFCFISYDSTAKNVIVSTAQGARITSFYTVEGELKQIDEKFIPNTIARTADIPEQITVDDALSDTSTNPVQNKVVNEAISNLNTLVGDTSVSDQIEAANIIYVGPDEPTDPNIKVWINTAEEGTGVVPVLPRVATITLAANSWTGSSAPYSQVVEVSTVTSATKIELNPTVSQIVELQSADIALMAENDGTGTVTVYSFGDKPSSDMTMQVTLTEVSYV